MKIRIPPLVVLAIACSLAAPAAGAPVATSAYLTVSIQGLAPITLVGAGLIDVSGTTISVPAGLIAQGAALTIPVTGTTTVNSLVATGIGNFAGTFSLGGVTLQAPGEVCPGGGPTISTACDVGGGTGGLMALTGVISIHIIPNIVVSAINLNDARIGQGGSTSFPLPAEGAAWTTGTGLVNVNGVVRTVTGDAVPLTLVTPTFLSVLANQLPIFANFQLVPLVPEPAAATLLATGAAGLAWLARGRRTRGGGRR